MFHDHWIAIGIELIIAQLAYLIGLLFQHGAWYYTHPTPPLNPDPEAHADYLRKREHWKTTFRRRHYTLALFIGTALVAALWTSLGGS